MMDDLLTIQMAAEEAGVSRQVIGNVVRKGDIEACKKGGRLFLSRRELARYTRTRPLSDKEFLAEWEHFHYRMGLGVNETIRLLATRYGLVEETVSQRAKLLTDRIAA